jgi:uncharacterized membrane protein YeiH
MTPIERAIRRREFYIDIAIIGCGVIAYYSVRAGEIAAVVFIVSLVLLVAALIANHVTHGRLRKRASRVISEDGSR